MVCQAFDLFSQMTRTAPFDGVHDAGVECAPLLLQAAFHQAKTAQDIALMLSLWDPKATLKIQGDPKSPYIGMEQLREYWLHSGSFKNRRFSLVPSFKTRIAVRDNEASLYFECHDVADYDQPTRQIINDMSAEPATPLSLDRYYA